MGPRFRRDDECNANSLSEPEFSNGTRPHRRTIHAARQRARPHQRQGAGVASAQLRDGKDATGFSRELWKAFAEMGFSGLLVPEEFRRQRARLRRGRRGDGGNRPHADAVAVPCRPRCWRRPRCRAAAARRRSQRYLPKISDGSLLAALAVDEGAKHRPLQIKLQAVRSGNGFRLNGAKALCGRRPHRRSPDRRRAHRRRGRRAQRADAVPGRSQGQGHRDRAHRDGRRAQRGAHRIRQCRGQCRRRARRGRSGRRAAGRRAQHRPRRGGVRNGRPERGGVRPHRAPI